MLVSEVPVSLLPFPKIPITRSDAQVTDDWVASEKIHGAQLVLGVDATDVQVGKRKAWLAADDAFFGWQLLRPALHAAARAVREGVGGGGTVWIYGELFGGHYPHPDVAAVPGLVPVQTGIWYAPDVRYAVFDIVHEPPAAEPSFLSYDQVQQLAESTGLLTAPLLARGRISELNRLPVRYTSNVAAQLGLPALPDNVAEGYVLKVATASPIGNRPCAKRKIPEFDEQQFDESQGFDNSAHLSREDLFVLAARLINPPRLASARSKVGADAERVVEEAVLDATIDLHDLLPRRMQLLTPEEEQDLSQHLAALARTQTASQP